MKNYQKRQNYWCAIQSFFLTLFGWKLMHSGDKRDWFTYYETNYERNKRRTIVINRLEKLSNNEGYYRRYHLWLK